MLLHRSAYLFAVGNPAGRHSARHSANRLPKNRERTRSSIGYLLMAYSPRLIGTEQRFLGWRCQGIINSQLPPTDAALR